MDYKINSTYEVTQTHEFSVDWNEIGRASCRERV